MADEHADRVRMTCPDCGASMRSDGGEQTFDRWVERFVCDECGREVFKGSGRGGI